MSFEISGRITEIYPTQQVTGTFKKREFILEVKDTNNSGFEFVEYIKFQTLQDKCTMLDKLNQNDQVTVSFNLKGRKWEKDGKTSYFTNLDAWKIVAEQSTNNDSPITPDISASSAQPDNSNSFTQTPPEDDSGFDDLPF